MQPGKYQVNLKRAQIKAGAPAQRSVAETKNETGSSLAQVTRPGFEMRRMHDGGLLSRAGSRFQARRSALSVRVPPEFVGLVFDLDFDGCRRADCRR